MKATGRQTRPMDPELIGAYLPVSIPLDDLREYEYQLHLLERSTPEPNPATMDISNQGG